jgi:hypothetical protein
MLDLTDTGGRAMQRLCAMLLAFAVSGALACLTSSKLVNLNRAEPDPALIQPPLDYNVVEETGPFVIQIVHP